MTTRPRVVVVGAGFAGLAVVKGFAKKPVDVTLVDRHNYHTFQPLLYQVATAGLSSTDIAYSVRGIFQRQPNAFFRQAHVAGVDWDKRELSLERPADWAGVEGFSDQTLGFDYLVAAAGSITNYFGVPGAEEHAFPLYTLADAIRLRNHVLTRFEMADTRPELIDDGCLTFMVAGGGPTGVEVAGALIELIEVVLAKDLHDVDVGRARVLLVDMAGVLLHPFSPKSQRAALSTLTSRGVEVHFNTEVTDVSATGVRFADGDPLPCHTVVWAVGIRANPLAEALGVEVGRGGRVEVDPELRIPGSYGAFAVGDMANIPDGAGGALPQLAQPAIQSGRHAAEQILRLMRDDDLQPLSYRDKGIMATIGRRSAVTEMPKPPLKLTGTLAWLAWLFLHIVYLIGFRNRLSVMLTWAWNYISWDRGARLIVNVDRSTEDGGK